MLKDYVNTVDFVSFQINRFFKEDFFDGKITTENLGNRLISRYFKLTFESLVKNLTYFANELEKNYGTDAQKIFDVLDDFPVNYIEILGLHGSSFFIERIFDIKEDLERIENDYTVKYMYISSLIDYLKFKASNKQN